MKYIGIVIGLFLVTPQTFAEEFTSPYSAYAAAAMLNDGLRGKIQGRYTKENGAYLSQINSALEEIDPNAFLEDEPKIIDVVKAQGFIIDALRIHYGKVIVEKKKVSLKSYQSQLDAAVRALVEAE